jgi:hypothetical protein
MHVFSWKRKSLIHLSRNSHLIFRIRDVSDIQVFTAGGSRERKGIRTFMPGMEVLMKAESITRSDRLSGMNLVINDADHP